MQGMGHEGFQVQMTGEGGEKMDNEEDKEKTPEHRWRV